MGRYSRKDMIEFANFAKSYQSSRNVEEAYAAYLSGARLHSTFYRKIMGANVVYVDGKIIKDRYKPEKVITTFSISKKLNTVEIESWDNESKILKLITKKLPEVDETKVRKLRIY